MVIDHDMQLEIAVGNSRKTKTWQNKRTSWANLLARLETTTRTSETVAEYKSFPKARQADIKDVGGFVGGYCNNGSRTNIRFRSIVCLDADYADAEIWEEYKTLIGSAAAVYSTHKHTAKNNRLRLVIPLSRNVTPDEYQAIGRKIADTLGIDKFDDTTYDVGRLMYWPSTSQDGEYVFDHLDAEFLNPDTVLQSYHDWHDVSAWPMSSRMTQIVQKSGKKAQNPTEKEGIVGAFCRAYSIDEAIEAFVPEYQPCTEKNRYTYTLGSTAGGVITYDGLFSFSHHATDPASGVLCNAWDLVRLHKFGKFDSDCDFDVKITSRPSFQEMQKFAMSDPKVKRQVAEDKLEQAVTDFSSELVEADPNWKEHLDITEKGALTQTINNAVLILQNDPNLMDCIFYNEMDHNIVLKKATPWRKVEEESVWVDSDDAALRLYMETNYGITSKDKIFDAVNVVALRHGFHPVRAYLDKCTWDGVPRLDSLLIDYLGADDTPYTRAVTRKAFIAAVKRVYEPGCKFDYMLTIKGKQGLGKSTLVAKMGKDWFSDTFSTMQGKESYEQIQGVWIMEIGELAGMRKAEAETIKLYISKQNDRFRPAYGRRLQDFPRQCIFIGTTNDDGFLRDSTGNRRFWVVDTPNKPANSVWDDLTENVINNVWGEAVNGYKNKESLFLPKEIEEVARKIQADFEEENPKKGLVEDYLNRKIPDNWEDMDTYERKTWLDSKQPGVRVRDVVCNYEIYSEALNGDLDRLDRYIMKEVRDIMANMDGWRRGEGLLPFKGKGRQRYYKRIQNDDT